MTTAVFLCDSYVRGQSRSLPLERVLAEVRTLVNAGYREVVISGINLGRWGRDLQPDLRLPFADGHVNSRTGDDRLESLILAILQQTSLEKLRISSVEPMDWTDELIRLVAENSGRIARHAHVPMQSGSDAVLRYACTANTVHGITGKKSENSGGDTERGHRCRCNGGFSWRDGSGIRRNMPDGRGVAVYLLARLHIFGASGNACGGRGWNRFRWE